MRIRVLFMSRRAPIPPGGAMEVQDLELPSVEIDYDETAAERAYEAVERSLLDGVKVAALACGRRAFLSIVARNVIHMHLTITSRRPERLELMAGGDWPTEFVPGVHAFLADKWALDEDAILALTRSEGLRL